MKFIYLLVLSSILFACSNEEKTSENEIQKDPNANVFISGQIINAANQTIVIELVDARGTRILDKTLIDSDNKFNLACKIDELGIYQLRLGNSERKLIPLTIEPKDKITINASFQDFELKPVIEGTKWSSTLTKYMQKFNEFAIKQADLMNNTTMSEDQKIDEFLKFRKPLDEFSKNEIIKNPSNPVNLVLSTSLTPAMGFEYWNEDYLIPLKVLANGFTKKYPNLAYTKSLKLQVEEIENGLKDFKLINSGNKEAPEIALKNPNGIEIKLSSLRGQVVLIDFWASWCGPCRKENPNVVALYNKYKNKGFTVYSVSLDKDANAWKQAIQADGLIWPNHVSDLMQWQTPLTQLYNFSAIPFTVLVNKSGKIVGTNLRGENLERKLKELL